MTAGAVRQVRLGGSSGATATYSDGFRRLLLIILFITWMLPIHPILAGQRLDPYRLVLLMMFIPFMLALVTGKGGRFLVSDALMMGFGGWAILTMVYHHGTSMFAFGTIFAVEMVGGYAAGRLLVRNATDYRRYVRYALISLLVLLPFATYESVTGRMMIGEIFSRAFPVSAKYSEWRYGFSRVQGVFPHSILYGLYCSMHAANVLYLYRDRLLRVAPRLGLVLYMTLVSLSSAPSLSIIIQAMIFLWGVVTRNRWMLLVWLVVAVVIFLELASNRGPVIILIETVTLDPQTGWWRYYIWVYGLDSVKISPIFGIGMNDWVRPSWLAAVSVDNFWLLMAMRHGVPGVTLLIAALAVHVWRITRAKNLTAEAQSIRNGYMIGFVGLCFTLTTVHVWDVLAVYVMFYFGAASFLYTSPTVTEGATPDTPPDLPSDRVRAPVVYARTFDKPSHRTKAE